MGDPTDPAGPAWLGFAFIAAGALVFAWLIWRGCLRRDALADGPLRPTGLGGPDLLAGFLIMFGGIVAAGAAAFALAPMDPETAQPTGSMRTRAVWVLVMQVAAQGPVVAYVLLRTSTQPAGWRALGIVPGRLTRELAWSVKGAAAAVVLVMGALALAAWIGALIGRPPPQVGHDLLEAMLASDDLAALALLACSALVLAPLFEEIVFRGLVQSSLLTLFGVRWRWLIVIGAGLVFASVHAGGVPVHALPGLAVLGMLLGWLYEKAGSLWPPIIAHAAFNTFNVALVMLG